MTFKKQVIFLILLFTASIVFAQDKMNVILDADTGNEVDDPYAIVRALLEPSWNILALNATHWQTSQWATDQSMEDSHRLNQMILGYMGIGIKTRRGGAARMYDWGDRARHSAAAYEIIQQAKALPEGEKLTVIALGALTMLPPPFILNPISKTGSSFIGWGLHMILKIEFCERMISIV